jgi:hypothetical protein
VKERQIDAEIKKGIDARTKEFKEKIGKLAYERIKKQLAPPTEPLKGYPYNESVDLEEKLKVSDGLGAWITDFKDSDAPQFKDADEKKRRDMAIAAFVAAGGKLGEDTEIVKEAGYKIPKDYAQLVAKQKRNKPNLGQSKLSSAEYQKVKTLKGFNKDDWKWNGDLYIRVTESVALAAINLDTVYSKSAKSFNSKDNMSSMYEANVKKGDAVKIINAKKYDALSKPEVSGTVIGMIGSKVMVKVGSGQMNVDPKDLVKESVELDEANVKKGDSVKIINAKKYDALSKPEVSGIVIGMLGSKVMVKVGSGQMNVDPKDLVKESVTEAKQAIVWKVKPPKGQKNIHPDSKWPGMKPGDIKKMNVDPKDLVKESVELDEEASNLHTVYSDVSEAFMRIPKSVRGNDLVTLKQSFDAMYNSLSNGGDWKPEVYKSLVKQMAAVSKSAKSFNSKDDMSSMYEMKLKNSDAAMKLEKEISDLEKGISKLTPLARKDDDANMQLIRAKNRLKQKQEKYKQLMKEEVKLGEASNEGTIRIIDLGKNKGFQVQSMTNGKFVNVGKPYKDLKSAEEFKHLSYFSQSMSPQARASRAARELLNKESVELDEATWMVTIDKGIYGGVKSDGQPILVKAISARDATTKAANKVKIDPMLVPAGGFNAKVNNKESAELGEAFTPKDVKMAIGIASDKRYAGGNMTGAVTAIEKIKKGLSDHPQVKAVLKRQNESGKLDELDSKTYRSYHDKATADQLKRMDKEKQTDKDQHTMRKRSLGIATAGMKQYGDKRTVKQRIRGEEVELEEKSVSVTTERLKVSNMTEIAMTLKQLAAKYKGDIAKAQQSGNTDSLKKAEKELIAWAMDNNEIGNAKEADVWLNNVVADKDQFDALLKFSKN